MTNKFVRAEVMNLVNDFASKEIQYEAWFIQENLRSNPCEDYCLLFDDLVIEDYVYSKDNYMTKKENDALNAFIDMLNVYGDKHRGSDGFLGFDEDVVYNDPEWENIRKEATKLYNLLEKEEGIEELKFVEDWKY